MARPKEFDDRVDLLCTEQQKKRWRAAADAAGLDLSTWIRLILDELSQATKPILIRPRFGGKKK